MRWLVLVVALGCGPGKSPGTAPPPVAGAGCDGIRARVEQLYRAEAQAREPKRVDEAVADNTAMVLAECSAAPARVAGCVASVDTAQALEARCLAPLDDEGSEGAQLAR